MAIVAAAALLPEARARDASFDPRVVTFGESREKIKATPIEKRPNRPLHVYGNSVRRRHSRSASR
jgi:hypothetical protein